MTHRLLNQPPSTHLIAVVVITLFGVYLLGAAPRRERSVEAEEFILRNKAGDVVAEWTTSDDGEPKIELFDKGGELQCGLQVRNGCPALFMVSGHNKAKIQMFMLPDGSPSLVFLDQKGTIRVDLFASEEGSAFIKVNTVDDEMSARLSAQDLPKVALMMRTGDPLISMLNEDGTPMMIYYDSEGEAVMVMKATPERLPRIEVFDREGRGKDLTEINK